MKMKKIITIILLIIASAMKVTYADVHPTDPNLPTYRLILKNDSQITSNIYSFEIWISSVSSVVPLNLRQWQAGINYNTAFLNGGTVTGSLDYTGSILLAFNDMYPQSLNVATAGSIKIAAKLGAVTSYILIPNTGVEYKLVKVTLTNSVNFAQVQPNLSWNFSVSPYPTKVFSWLSTSTPNAQVTMPNNAPGPVIQSWHTTDQLNNHIFNTYPQIYNVTGTSSYCSSGSGGSVTLVNSETGVLYELIKNNIPTGLFYSGNGSAITWNNLNFGTYKVNARKIGTSLTSLMADSVIINEITGLPGVAGAINGSNTICQGTSAANYSVAPISNAENYIWSYTGTGVTINGTSENVILNFSSNATGGNLTVTGSNACGQGTTSSPLVISVSDLPSAAGAITGVSSVSPGQNAVAYSVPAINGAVTYTWTYSGQGATINGNSNSITIDFGANATPGFLTVSGTNSCGNGTPSPAFAINVNSVPGAAGNITGTSSVCPGVNNVMYTVPEILGADTYLWEYTGTGVTIDSILGDTAYINFSMNATSGVLTVKGHNTFGYGNVSPNFIITVNPFPEAAGTISGNDTVCKSSNSIYTVPVIQYATSYVWTLPTGATGTSTTNSINVNFGTSAVNGNITVKGLNSCGEGASSTKAITVNTVPAAAGAISGQSTVCQGANNITYTVPAISGATSYLWTLPTGATGSSTTNSITVNYSTTAISGQVTVRGVNACGNGTASALSITVNPLPANAGTITGLTTVCQGQSGVVYTVPSISNATSYIWTKPNGTTGTSTTNTITIGYTNTAVSGNITVRGSNSCGQGNLSTLAVTVNPLPDSAKVVTGPTTVCKNETGVVYKVQPINNATYYSWTLPNGIIGSSITDSIVVNITNTAVSGSIIVKGMNSCGEGVATSYAVTVNSVPAAAGTISGTSSVCKGQSNNVVYTVPAIAGATSYIWTLPTGFTGTSTTNSITVSVTANAISGNITVKGSNTCGFGAESTFPVTVNTIPDSAGVITGLTSVCQGQNSVTYTVPTINGATAYSWTLPAGATGTSTTNSITVNYASYAVSGTVKVKGQNTCGFGGESSLSVTVNPLPSNAGAITGPALVCKGQTGVTFTVPAINNATSYSWTFPTGFTGTSTTNSITVDVTNTAVSGNITVKGVNSCGEGQASIKTITVSTVPNAPTSITGPDNVCQGAQNQQYSVPTVTGATSYSWTLPSGATGTSSTNSIFVNFSNTATSGNIVVKAQNVCGIGDSIAKFITVNSAAAAAGAITGSATVCQGQNNVVYNVPAILGATSYVWTLPNGFTGSSTTNSISVNIANNATNGTISVYGTNTCGDGAPSNFAVTVNPLPDAAGNITGADSVCQGDINIQYSVASIPNAVSYIWEFSGTGATISSNTNIVTINFSSTATSGNLTVKGNNACGDGVVSANFPIVVKNCVGINENNDISYSIYPNPTKGIIYLNIDAVSLKLEIQITDVKGEVISTDKLSVDKHFSKEIDLSAYSKGIYFVKIINDKFVKVEKVILQ